MSSPSQGHSSPADGKPNATTEHIQRGNYNFSMLGTATFIGLRLVDPLLQYQLLVKNYGPAILEKLSVSTVPLASISYTQATDPRTFLLAMSAGAMVKQVYWILFINREHFPPSLAVTVGLFNLIMDSTSSLLLLASKTSTISAPQVRIPGTEISMSLPLLIGAAMFVIGTVTETVAEVQRKRFKDRPESKGKIYTGGLWQLARHINYGGYVMWRGGYMLAAGGLVPGMVVAAFLIRNFLKTSVRGMDEYMTKKYGQQWAKYRSNVPYKMFPGVF